MPADDLLHEVIRHIIDLLGILDEEFAHVLTCVIGAGLAGALRNIGFVVAAIRSTAGRACRSKVNAIVAPVDTFVDLGGILSAGQV
jgi:hypothetical protein